MSNEQTPHPPLSWIFAPGAKRMRAFLFMVLATRVSSSKRGYGAAWQRYRAGYLRKHPFCAMCQEQARLTPATVVDHKEPHKGDQAKFWDKTNHQPLCKLCHDAHKQRLEKSGNVVGCDVNGMPIDPRHHWAAG